jgi:uncharacterized OB-fold protein
MAQSGIPPAVTPETEPFWNAAREGRLVVERCAECSAESFPPYGICRGCRSRNVSFVEIDSGGVVYSYTVNEQRWLPDLEVPFALVWVDFPEHPGVRVVGRIRGCEPHEVQIDMPVSVGFEPGPGGFAVPSFVAEPAVQGGHSNA